MECRGFGLTEFRENRNMVANVLVGTAKPSMAAYTPQALISISNYGPANVELLLELDHHPLHVLWRLGALGQPQGLGVERAMTRRSLQPRRKHSPLVVHHKADPLC